MKNMRIIWIVLICIILCLAACETAKPDPTVDNVVVTPNPVNINRGQTLQFSAVVNGTNSPSQGIRWTVEGGSAGTNITSGGLLTIAADEQANVLTVRATSTFDNTKWDNATVNVSGAIITGVSIAPKTVNVTTGSTYQFTASVNGQFNPPQTVSWSVQNNISSSTTINTNGLLSVASNESATILIVRATSSHDSTKFDDATVTIANDGGVFYVTNTETWNEALETIRRGSNNIVYDINVVGNISITPSFENTFGTVNGLQVTISGGGSISTIANGQMFRVGLGQTVIARNVTLLGRTDNNTTVVQILNGGIFQMESGSVVQGNAQRGIIADGGTLLMFGGTIRNNGGGVLVDNNGDFTMYNNAIITNNSANGGAGVFINTNSLFTMEGGIISSNNSSHIGGGVAVLRGGHFVMNNGEIANNRTSAEHGGGVALQANGINTFTMNGGVIRDNTTTGNGGGVYVAAGLMNNSYGIFNMNGGSILNNNAAGGSGGGVYQRGGNAPAIRFTKTGGILSGNSSSGSGRAAWAQGASGTARMWRNIDAGPNNNTADADFWLNDD